MDINDLYPRGTKMVDVPPTYHGMSLDDYLAARWRGIWRMAEEARAKIDPSTMKLNGKAVATPRDRYGLRGI
jgi:hypothetical protein